MSPSKWVRDETEHTTEDAFDPPQGDLFAGEDQYVSALSDSIRREVDEDILESMRLAVVNDLGEVTGEIAGPVPEFINLSEEFHIPEPESPPPASPEYTGGSVDYYQVEITDPTTPGRPRYVAECNDIIEALGMSFAEGNAFKAIWRSCAARSLGKTKAGYKDGLYDAEKVVFFGERMVAKARRDK